MAQHHEFLITQGKQCMQAGAYEQALSIFDQLAETSATQPRVQYLRGLALYELGQQKQALSAYRAAIKHAPNHPEILNAMANCYYALGNFDKAQSYYEKVFALQPHNATCLHNMVLMQRYSKDSAVTKQLQALYQSNMLSLRDRAIVCFALGELSERHNTLHEAFPYYEEGNRLMFDSFHYNPASDIALMEAIEQTFTPDLFRRFSTVGSDNNTPIFIVGMPRSGTSLIEQVLASHSKVCGVGEINTISVLALRTLPERMGVSFPHAVNAMDISAFQALADDYLAKLQSLDSGRHAHVCDKMPTNFLFIGLIHLLFPKARIIHCVRDPMDTCWSLYKHLFIDRNPYCYNQTVLGRFYVQYTRLMQHWHRVLPGVVYDVNYQSLVESPEENIRLLLDYCGLEWEKECLHFYRTQRTVLTASALQVRKPIYKNALKTWEPIAGELSLLREALAS